MHKTEQQMFWLTCQKIASVANYTKLNIGREGLSNMLHRVIDPLVAMLNRAATIVLNNIEDRATYLFFL